MKTIGFFGDSFCASNQPESWCNILQEKLGANRIRWFGNSGRSIWSVFFQFNKLIKQSHTHVEAAAMREACIHKQRSQN